MRRRATIVLVVIAFLLAGCAQSAAPTPPPDAPLYDGPSMRPILLDEGRVKYDRPDVAGQMFGFRFQITVPANATRIDFLHEATLTGVGNGWVVVQPPTGPEMREWEFCGNYALTPFVDATYRCAYDFEGPALSGNGTAGVWEFRFVEGLLTATQAGTLEWLVWSDPADLEKPRQG